MPRYYRRRYTRVLKPKKKWASNIRSLARDFDVHPAISRAALVLQLCVNQNQVSVPTPSILKAGNFKVQADVIVATSSQILLNIVGYILYVPEGVFTSNTAPELNYDAFSAIIEKHPEWIMAWKQFGFDGYGTDNNVDRVSFSSRLKRNLNSGDAIYFVLLANNLAGSGGMTGLNCNGMCQFWTCTN